MILWRGKKVYVSAWEPNAPEKCELCGVEGQQLRPFHPDGKFICFECGERAVPQTEEIMRKIVKECDFVFDCDCLDIYRYTEEQILSLIEKTAGPFPYFSKSFSDCEEIKA